MVMRQQRQKGFVAISEDRNAVKLVVQTVIQGLEILNVSKDWVAGDK